MRKLGLLVLVLLVGLVACNIHPGHPSPHGKAHGVYKKFYYYPNAEVYFNPVTKVYVVWQSGAWVTVKTCPVVITSKTTYVVIHDDAGKPWHKHAHFKKNHPAKHHKPAKAHKKPPHKKKHPGKGKGKGKKH